jgi:PAS domain S-box-containing protein
VIASDVPSSKRPDNAVRRATPLGIEHVCHSLEELSQRLKDLLRQGGGELTPALLTAAADDCPDAVIVCTDSAQIRVVNGAAARLTGLSTRALQSLTVWDITHPSSQGDFDVLWREFLRAGRQRGNYTVRHQDGSAVEVAYCAAVNVIPHLHLTVLRKLP